MDNGKVIEASPSQCLGIGALAIGNIKYKSQHECLKLMYTSEKPVYLDFEDAFKFAQKAYRDILLIANGHEVYHKDLSEHFKNIHHIDSYSDEEDYLVEFI